MIHELWRDPDGTQTFCLAGPQGDDARAQLAPDTELVWTFEADSHLSAMTSYWKHMGWGTYTTDYPEIDGQTYASRGWT